MLIRKALPLPVSALDIVEPAVATLAVQLKSDRTLAFCQILQFYTQLEHNPLSVYSGHRPVCACVFLSRSDCPESSHFFLLQR
mmetsp:Transcript_72913/g.159351  ORF Transcript_72913/g.159351 Transcript_72913/m.159351 type:complete len:83 (-) Transcript_72913:220-468(-)